MRELFSSPSLSLHFQGQMFVEIGVVEKIRNIHKNPSVSETAAVFACEKHGLLFLRAKHVRHIG